MSHEMSEGFKIGDGRVTANTLQRKMLAWLEATRRDPRIAQKPFFEGLEPSQTEPILTGLVDGIPLQTYFDRWEASTKARAGASTGGIANSYIVSGMTGAREILVRRSAAFITGDYSKRPVVPNFIPGGRGSDISTARGNREEGFEEDEEIRKALVYIGDKLYEIGSNLEALREDPGSYGITILAAFVANSFLIPLEEAYRLEISGQDAPRRDNLYELTDARTQRRIMLGRATILEYWGFETDESGQVTSQESLKHPTHPGYTLYPSPKERAVFYRIARVYPQGSERENEVSRIEEAIVVADPGRKVSKKST